MGGKPRATIEHLQLIGDHNNKIGREYNPAKGNIITADTMIEPPRKYSKETINAWEMVVPNLIMLQALTEPDLPLLKATFDSYDDYVKARKLYLKHEIDFKASTEEILKQTTVHQKLFSIMNDAREKFNRFASKFSCTPTDRSKLPINQDHEKEKDPLEIVLGN